MNGFEYLHCFRNVYETHRRDLCRFRSLFVVSRTLIRSHCRNCFDGFVFCLPKVRSIVNFPIIVIYVVFLCRAVIFSEDKENDEKRETNDVCYRYNSRTCSALGKDTGRFRESNVSR